MAEHLTIEGEVTIQAGDTTYTAISVRDEGYTSYYCTRNIHASCSIKSCVCSCHGAEAPEEGK